MSHRRLLVTLATLAAVFALALAVSLGLSAHAASAPPSTRPSSSTTDAWAVGVSYDTTAGTNQTLIEHYAGPVTLIWCR